MEPATAAILHFTQASRQRMASLRFHLQSFVILVDNARSWTDEGTDDRRQSVQLGLDALDGCGAFEPPAAVTRAVSTVREALGVERGPLPPTCTLPNWQLTTIASVVREALASLEEEGEDTPNTGAHPRQYGSAGPVHRGTSAASDARGAGTGATSPHLKADLEPTPAVTPSSVSLLCAAVCGDGHGSLSPSSTKDAEDEAGKYRSHRRGWLRNPSQGIALCPPVLVRLVRRRLPRVVSPSMTTWLETRSKCNVVLWLVVAIWLVSTLGGAFLGTVRVEDASKPRSSLTTGATQPGVHHIQGNGGDHGEDISHHSPPSSPPHAWDEEPEEEAELSDGLNMETRRPLHLRWSGPMHSCVLNLSHMLASSTTGHKNECGAWLVLCSVQPMTLKRCDPVFAGPLVTNLACS